jgi:hypothetical protein
MGVRATWIFASPLVNPPGVSKLDKSTLLYSVSLSSVVEGAMSNAALTAVSVPSLVCTSEQNSEWRLAGLKSRHFCASLRYLASSEAPQGAEM